MFILRSAFWLTLAFLVIRPGTDLDASAAQLSSDAMARGQAMIVEQVLATQCDNLQCIGGKAVIAAAMGANGPVAAKAERIPPSASLFPLPRPRPDRAS